VDVTQSDETLVITLRNMLATAGGGPTRPTDEAVNAHEFYRELFAESSDWLRREISRITGLEVGAVTGTVEAATGAVVVLLRVVRVPGAFGRLKELPEAGSAQGLPDAGASAAPDRAAQLDALPPTSRCGGAPASRPASPSVADANAKRGEQT
jgi:hypothetical protein